MQLLQTFADITNGITNGQQEILYAVQGNKFLGKIVNQISGHFSRSPEAEDPSLFARVFSGHGSIYHQHPEPPNHYFVSGWGQLFENPELLPVGTSNLFLDQDDSEFQSYIQSQVRAGISLADLIDAHPWAEEQVLSSAGCVKSDVRPQDFSPTDLPQRKKQEFEWTDFDWQSSREIYQWRAREFSTPPYGIKILVKKRGADALWYFCAALPAPVTISAFGDKQGRGGHRVPHGEIFVYTMPLMTSAMTLICTVDLIDRISELPEWGDRPIPIYAEMHPTLLRKLKKYTAKASAGEFIFDREIKEAVSPIPPATSWAEYRHKHTPYDYLWQTKKLECSTARSYCLALCEKSQHHDT